MNKKLFIVAAVFSMAVSVTGAPALEIVDNEFVFGKSTQRNKLVHNFWIKSTGDETLRITEIVPGCGCTQMPLEDSLIAPGDSAKLTLYFETRNYRGSVIKNPTFKTNASDKLNKLKIYCDVLLTPESDTPLVISTYSVDVSQFGEKTRRRASFEIKNLSKRKFKLTLVDIGLGNYDVILPSSISPGEVVQVKIEVHKDKVETSFDDSITFAIDDDMRSRYSVSVKRMYKIDFQTSVEPKSGN